LARGGESCGAVATSSHRAGNLDQIDDLSDAHGAREATARGRVASGVDNKAAAPNASENRALQAVACSNRGSADGVVGRAATGGCSVHARNLTARYSIQSGTSKRVASEIVAARGATSLGESKSKASADEKDEVHSWFSDETRIVEFYSNWKERKKMNAVDVTPLHPQSFSLLSKKSQPRSTNEEWHQLESTIEEFSKNTAKMNASPTLALPCLGSQEGETRRKIARGGKMEIDFKQKENEKRTKRKEEIKSNRYKRTYTAQ